MRLQPINLRPGQALVVPCARCGQSLRDYRGPIIADLDGEPFKAYYHEACAPEAGEVIEVKA